MRVKTRTENLYTNHIQTNTAYKTVCDNYIYCPAVPVISHSFTDNFCALSPALQTVKEIYMNNSQQIYQSAHFSILRFNNKVFLYIFLNFIYVFLTLRLFNITVFMQYFYTHFHESKNTNGKFIYKSHTNRHHIQNRV